MKFQLLKKSLKKDSKNEFFYNKFKNRFVSKKDKSFKLLNSFFFINKKNFI